MSKTKTPNTKQAVIDVLKAAGEATVAQIAVSAAVGRSTAALFRRVRQLPRAAAQGKKVKLATEKPRRYSVA